MSKSQSQPLPRLVLYHQLAEEGVPYSKRQIDRLERKGMFPKRVPINDRLVGWVRTEIVDLVDSWIARRTHDAGKLGNEDVFGARDNTAAREAAAAARRAKRIKERGPQSASA